MINVLLQSGTYLSQEYVTRKILEILGDGDKADDVLSTIDADELGRVMIDDE
jgi:hypothetical protein